MRTVRPQQSGFGIVEALVATVVVLTIAGAGIALYEHDHKSTKKDSASSPASSTQSTVSSDQQPTTTDQKQYSSTAESATFQYPNTWTASKPVTASNDSSNTDQIGLTSPSGAITISYVTDLVGLGNEYSSNYPEHTVVDKTAIPNAPGYYVVSGITTLDGKTFYPWIAVQDNDGILSSGVKGDVATFAARRATNTSTGGSTSILFATCGARTTENSPALSQSAAAAWFSGGEAQQAKQILLSFSDPQ